MATQITGPYEVKAGSTEPIRATLRQGNKQPVDLTDVATVTYVVRLRGAHVPTVDARCTILQDSPVTNVGRVEYDPAPGDLDVAGIYDTEWRLVKKDGITEMRIPNSGYDTLKIWGNLGG